jgi:glycosyltransferase involved in cell wall biosynthesis/CDP-glycerol glycerophosphotransferase (TagB/SpsB family)
MTQKSQSPLISVIVPIYNTEAYIAQAVDSVLEQSIGFAEHIEMIIVDDGSTDRSADVAKDYLKLYPHNITYIRQENAGVSAARNAGLSIAKGEFIHFFDGDDSVSRDYYQEAVNFLKMHQEVDFVAAKIKFFDEIIDSHPLNSKFSSNRVIDVSKEPDSSILHVITCLFRHESIRMHRFDERLSIAEDVKFISEVLVNKKQYGVLKRPTYYYRKRTTSVSAIAGSRKNPDYYLKVPNLTYNTMLDQWSDFAKPTFAEYTVLYDISYRLEQKEQSVLSEEEELLYKESLLAIATRCSDKSIVTHRFLSVRQKHFLLSKKYGKALAKHLIARDNTIYLNESALYHLDNASVFLDFMTHEDGNTYRIEGFVDGLVNVEGVKVVVDVEGTRTPVRFVERQQREKSFLGEIYDTGGAFEVEIEVPIKSSVKFVVLSADTYVIPPITTGPFTRFGALKLTYRRDSSRLFKRSSKEIYSNSYSTGLHVLLEARLWAQILLNWRVGTVRERLHKLRTLNLNQLSVKNKLKELAKPWFFMAEAVLYIPRALALRTAYYVAVRFKKRPIWILSDRGMAAGDNGEALFRYIMAQQDIPADVYFVISKKAKSFKELKTVGRVLKQESLKYKLKFLLADKIIASQADVETTNPFIRQQDHYINLFNFNFVFLQHGIIRHNLSDWVNRFNKNIALFITSAQKEYDSIFTNPYYYAKKQVLLSGLARYDYLDNDPDGTLILAPTYRKNLIAHQKTDRFGRRHYDSAFKRSEYRQFYNNLMNDQRIVKALAKNNMKGEFYLHPVFSEQRRDFDENERFKVMEFPYSYKDAFKKGNMLISDHSSVVFDFAYLKKPVAYAHFDVDTFFAGHTYDESNFFSDTDDGFGEVYYDYETLVKGVINTINKGCLMNDKYKKRVDNFFYKVDKRNSERTYKAILNMDA